MRYMIDNGGTFSTRKNGWDVTVVDTDIEPEDFFWDHLVLRGLEKGRLWEPKHYDNCHQHYHYHYDPSEKKIWELAKEHGCDNLFSVRWTNPEYATWFHYMGIKESDEPRGVVITIA